MKRTNFRIFYFLILFLFLFYGFNFYVGVCTRGGRLYSDWINNHFNLPNLIAVGIAKSSEIILKLLNYPVYQKRPYNITIRYGRGVNIGWGCLGAGISSFWIAFVAAHKIDLFKKTIWAVSGVFFIFLLNVIRITLIALAIHYNWKLILSFDAHSTFNFISYIIIFLLMWYFITKQKNYTSRHITDLSV